MIHRIASLVIRQRLSFASQLGKKSLEGDNFLFILWLNAFKEINT